MTGLAAERRLDRPGPASVVAPPTPSSADGHCGEPPRATLTPTPGAPACRRLPAATALLSLRSIRVRAACELDAAPPWAGVFSTSVREDRGWLRRSRSALPSKYPH